jgi:hypothetical protein
MIPSSLTREEGFVAPLFEQPTTGPRAIHQDTVADGNGRKWTVMLDIFADGFDLGGKIRGSYGCAQSVVM